MIENKVIPFIAGTQKERKRKGMKSQYALQGHNPNYLKTSH
jgi:hypothetical protein